MKEGGKERERGKGASIYDVRTEGGGGVSPKADIVLELSKGGCVNLRTRGGGCSKNPKFWRTSLMEAPLRITENASQPMTLQACATLLPIGKCSFCA